MMATYDEERMSNLIDAGLYQKQMEYESKQTCKWTPVEYCYQTECGYLIRKEYHLIHYEYGVVKNLTYCPNCGREIERVKE
jgi:hypothetical protein